MPGTASQALRVPTAHFRPDRCTLILKAGGEEREPRVRDSAVGKVGQVVHRVRGTAGPGEICVLVGGTYETYLAYSDAVLERGTEALVINPRGSGSYDVVPWPDTTSPVSGLSTLDDLPVPHDRPTPHDVAAVPADEHAPLPGPDAPGAAGTTER